MWMIPVLLSAAGIARGDLQMSVFMRTDPDIGPGRRNDQRPKALEGVAGAYDSPVGSDVCEAATVPMPANSRHRVAYISESRRSGGSHVFMGNGLSQLSSSR